MSEDTFTEVTSQSWFSRIGNAFKGIVFGFILVVIAFILLFWNEGRAVKRYKTLKEGGGQVISISADAIDAANQGKLVHVTGKAMTDENLSDPVFGMTIQAIKLERRVEMYQWQQESTSEQKKKLGGGTETVTKYTYSKVWSDNLIHSENFKKEAGHQNPRQMPYQSEEQIAEKVTLGAFTLSPSLVNKINEYTPVQLAGIELPEELDDKAKIRSDSIYIGEDSSLPQIGDLRVSFQEVKPLVVSLVASQVDNTFEPYYAQAGGTIELLQAGTLSADAMFQQAQKSNTILTWVLRIVGYILMLVGFQLILAPLVVFADVVPIFGSIVGVGTGLISSLVAGFLSLITIGIAWVVYRPILAIILIAVAGGIGFLIFTKLRKAPAVAEK